MPPELALPLASRLMPRLPFVRAKDPGPKPKDHMPLWKFGMLCALGGVFDILKAGCVCLIFLVPLIAGVATKAAVDQYATQVDAACSIIRLLPVTLTAGASLGCEAEQQLGKENAGNVAGTLAAGATAAVEGFTPAGEVVEALGVIAAIFVGIFGWLLVIMILLLSGLFNPFENGASHFFTIWGAVLVSVTPLVDAFPTFTPAIWKICLDLKARDLKKRVEWTAKKRAYAAQVARDRQAQIDGAYAALAARDAQEQESESEEAEEDAAFEAANDNAFPVVANDIEPAAKPQTLVPTPRYGLPLAA